VPLAPVELTRRRSTGASSNIAIAKVAAARFRAAEAAGDGDRAYPAILRRSVGAAGTPHARAGRREQRRRRRPWWSPQAILDCS
jgi:hypothetical protein